MLGKRIKVIKSVFILWLLLPAHAYALNGDADGNGVVDIEDARCIARYIDNQIPAIPDPNAADATQDGKIDMEDSFAIAKYVAGQSKVVVIAPLNGPEGILRVGNTVRIEVFEYFFPSDVNGGSVHITSASADYDSGVQLLTRRTWRPWSLYYHWDTTGLEAASYVIDITVDGEALGTEVVDLIDQHFEPTVLASVLDAYCPTPGIPLEFRRIYRHDSSAYPHLGPLGYGWTHNYDYTLQEYEDGLVVIHGPEGNRYFRSNPDGTYESAPGDHGILTHVGDSFYLTEKNGLSYWFIKGGLLHRGGLLYRITDLNGNYVHLNWTTRYHAYVPPLLRIEHSCGKRLDFGYWYWGNQIMIDYVRDHAGRTTHFWYDPNDHALLLGVHDPNWTLTQYDYIHDQGDVLENRLAKITFPDGTETNYEYDSEARIMRQSGKNGINPVSYTFDPNGRTHIADALGNETIITVNEREQPLEIINPVGALTRYTYDSAYNLSEMNDPLGRTFSYQYDEYGNLTQVTDSNGEIVNMDYDRRFHKISFLEDSRGNTITFEYDELGNLLTMIYPDNRSETYVYDSWGNVVSKKNRKGQVITYLRNAQGQLIQKILPDEPDEYFGYDSAGNMTSASNGIDLTMNDYDLLGRLTHLEYQGGYFFEYEFDYEYDSMGKRKRRTDQDGREINYEYDDGGRLIRMYDADDANIVTYEYDATGRLIKKTLGNGVYTTYEYDAAGQVLHLINYDPNDNILSRFDYTYDLTGNRLTMNTLEGLHQYTYDNLGQLTEVNYPDGGHVEYKYDSAGNRIQVVDNNSVTPYVTNNLNQYDSVGGYSCSYDLNGNLIQRITAEGTYSYEYDVQDRLVAIDGPNDWASYAYDALGNRVAADENGIFTNYAIDPAAVGNLAAEYDYGGFLVAHYDHGLGLLRRTDETGASAYYSFDELGSTSELTNVAGTIVNAYSYDVFGISRSKSESVPNPFQYVGQYGIMDSVDGLKFMRSRYYCAETGRFISVDPIGLSSGSLNLYTYVHNNPILLNDPTGLKESSFIEQFGWGQCLGASRDAVRKEVFGPLDGYQRAAYRHDYTLYSINKETGSTFQDLTNGRVLRAHGVLIAEFCGEWRRTGLWGLLRSIFRKIEGGECPTFIQAPPGNKMVDKLLEKSDVVTKRLAGRIVVPIDECLLRSDIPIYGIAGGTDFKRYRVEYGKGKNPVKWHLIEDSNEPQVNPPDFKDISWMQGDLDLRGNLATWNVGLKNWSHLPWHPPEDPTDLNGVYTIRLVVEGKDGTTIEDRVTGEVGRVIAQCLPGIAISPDKRVVMRFPEQALTHPFRVYTILPFSDVGEKIPVLPTGCKFIGPAYRIREPGDKFAKDVKLEFTTTAAELKNVKPNQLGICRYDVENKRWLWLKTERDKSAMTLSTTLTELPSPKAIYALALDPAAQRSTLATPDVSSPIPAKPVEPGVLVNCTFEKDFDTFKARDRFVGANLIRDSRSTSDGSYCLKLINQNQGGNFSCTVLDKSFDVTEYPDMHFNYRIGKDVKIDFLLKVNSRWYRLRFTGDDIDYRFRDVNIDNLGSIPEVVADNKWRSAVVDLHPLLRQKTRHTRIDEIVLADWRVGGFMKLDFGRNRRGANFCIDNFNIFGRPATERSPVMLVDNFDSSQSVNALGGVKGTYNTPELHCFESSIVNVPESATKAPANKDKDSELKLSFDMRPPTAYGGYWTALTKRDLSEYSTLRFSLRTESPVPPMEVGIRHVDGKEGRTFIGAYASAADKNGWRDVRIPLLALKGLTDFTSPDTLFFAVSNKDRSGKATLWIDDVRFEHEPCAKVKIADFESTAKGNGSAEHSTHHRGAAAISASLMPDVTMGPKMTNTVCRISYGGTIGRDYGMQGGFSYCAWQHGLNGIDARQFKHLTLRIRGERGGETPNIYLHDSVKRVPVRAIEMPRINQGWQMVMLPLKHYAEQGIDLSHLDSLALVFEWKEQSGTLYVDNIGFE